jgi:tripartite-type tricarboxylate transporter receptor subunit TctC
MNPDRTTRRALAAALTFVAIVPAAVGQNYPTRPIRVIVPFAPGGGTDLIGRLIAAKLGEALRQQVVVDNRGGASGMLGTEVAVRSAPDGYTFVLVSAGYPVNAAIASPKFDSLEDVTPVIQVGKGPFLVVVHPSMPVRSMRNLIDFTRARPGEINYASSGTGSILHMATELFLHTAKLRMTAIPYKGTGPALTETIAGQTQVLFGSIAATLPHAKSGRLRAIAVTSAKRVVAEPDIPTIAESGVPGYDVNNWHGLLGPRGVPRPIVDRLNAEVNTALRLREVEERLLSDGVSPAGGTPEAFRREIQREIEQWRKVAVAANIRFEN